ALVRGLLTSHELFPKIEAYHTRGDAIALMEFEILLHMGKVGLVGAVLLPDPTNHGLFIAKMCLSDDRNENNLISDLRQQLQGFVHQVEMSCRPKWDIVFQRHGIR